MLRPTDMPHVSFFELYTDNHTFMIAAIRAPPIHSNGQYILSAKQAGYM